jgi:hypothetical protein
MTGYANPRAWMPASARHHARDTLLKFIEHEIELARAGKPRPSG